MVILELGYNLDYDRGARIVNLIPLNGYRLRTGGVYRRIYF